MELQDQLAIGLRGTDVDIGLFTNTNLIAQAEDHIALPVRVHGEVVEAAVRESVTVVSGILDFGDQAVFGEGRDISVYGTTAALAG